jgi:signal transduction histidine kinase
MHRMSNSPPSVTRASGFTRWTHHAGPRGPGVAAARGLASFAGALGLTALLGWWLGVPALTSVVPGYVSMKPNTALGLMLAGGALWLLAPLRGQPGERTARWGGLALGAACAAVGAITLLEYAFDLRGPFDEMLARVSPDGPAAPTAGRMAATTAATFLTLGAALIALERRGGRTARVGEWLLAATATVPLAVVVGYIYHAIPARGAGHGLQMALHTAAGLLALVGGAFAARPEREVAQALRSRGPGGVLARRLLPAALGIPIALGALRLAGERLGVVSGSMGSAGVAAVTMLLLAGVVWRTASQLDRSEAARVAADGERARAEAAARAAESANAAKMQFLAVMSHELRTPLNAITGYTELLELGVYGPITSPQVDALARIRRSSGHLLTLVNHVLSLARTEAGLGIDLQIAPVPADDVIAPIEVLIAPQCRAKAIAYDAPPAGAHVVCQADHAAVEQVLLNLLSNALKFTQPGGRVEVRAAVDRDRVLVRVVDTGCGVPVQQREAIFAPFVQLDTGLTRRVDGAGLGLTISRDLARAMGGDVTVERSDATGSTFTLWLPRGVAATAVSSPASVASGAELSTF